MNSTPLQVVKSHFTFPFTERPYQTDTVNTLADSPRSGNYLDVGCGKTFVATAVALYKLIRGDVEIVVIHMPPILLDRWARWFASIKPAPTCVIYRGGPKERLKIILKAQFVVMSTAIFKKDFDRILGMMPRRRRMLLVDEATSVGNFDSDNYARTSEFVGDDNELQLLTGTPISNPLNGYGLIKLISPSIYRNFRQFENLHVAGRDFFDNPSEWDNLDLLKKNLLHNSVLILKTEALPHLPPVLHDPIHYQLDPAHMKLYRTLAEERLLPLKDGGKIDKTQATALLHALGQIVVNYDYFADDPKCISQTIKLVEEIVEELGGRKLILFSNYRMTNRRLLELLKKFNAVGAYGEISVTQQAHNIDRFINDDKCLTLVAQPTSIGYGVDGLQQVCHDVLFVETPTLAKDYYQALGRVWRDGQESKVHSRLAIAQGTLQARKLKQLVDNNDLVAQVARTYADLRAEIFGD